MMNCVGENSRIQFPLITIIQDRKIANIQLSQDTVGYYINRLSAHTVSQVVRYLGSHGT